MLRPLVHKYSSICVKITGLYEAAYNLSIEWAVIKAVSDFADGSKERTKLWQPFSSAIAASVAYNMFKYPVVLRHWHHHKKTEDPNGIVIFRPE